MGNCVCKGFKFSEEAVETIKVMTPSGGIMELYAPITVECITNEFPGHGIFTTRVIFFQPLLHSEELLPGELYHLLPLPAANTTPAAADANSNDHIPKARHHVTRIPRNSSISSSKRLTPYRMSFDNHRMSRRSSDHQEVSPRFNSSGVWKVRLVITPEQLSDVLSQEARTEALIESVRTVAKCGNGGLSSEANSDQWSLSSGRKEAVKEQHE